MSKERKFLETIIRAGNYTLEQLIKAYNFGTVSDELFKYGLELFELKDGE